MQVISNVIGLIIFFAIISILARLAYFIGSKSFTVKEITKFILKLFNKLGNNKP